jgi:hypothetical protein
MGIVKECSLTRVHWMESAIDGDRDRGFETDDVDDEAHKKQRHEAIWEVATTR